MYEVYRNGIATGNLFLCEINALLWVKTHGDDGGAYSIHEVNYNENGDENGDKFSQSAK